MIELMNGMCTQYMPGLSIWDLCTKPVTAHNEIPRFQLTQQAGQHNFENGPFIDMNHLILI